MMQRLRSFLRHPSKRSSQIILGIGIILLLLYFALPDDFQPWIVLALTLLVIVQALFLPEDVARPMGKAKTSGEASASAEDMQAALSELATRIHVTVDGLVRASDAINEVTAQQVTGTTEQTEVINSTSNLLDNFLHLSDRVSNQAQSMSDTAEQAATVSKNGQAAIRQVIDSMDEIRTQVAVIAETIVQLATLTQRIDDIITSVSEIATQSNLLALNASIEAARAGVHGRGFAVVADEVRSLSQQSTHAAHQVRAILVEIQAAVKETIQATEIGMQRVAAGVEVTEEVDQILVRITDDVIGSHKAVQAIYSVVREQASGLEEIAGSINRIDWITEQNITSTVMVETVSGNLSRLAAELKEAVEQSHMLQSSVEQHMQHNGQQHAEDDRLDPA